MESADKTDDVCFLTKSHLDTFSVLANRFSLTKCAGRNSGLVSFDILSLFALVCLRMRKADVQVF